MIPDNINSLILQACSERQTTFIERLNLGNYIEELVFQYFVNRGVRAKVYDQSLLGSPSKLEVDFYGGYQVDGVIYFGGKGHKTEVKALGHGAVLPDHYLIGKCEGIDLKKQTFKAKPKREYLVVVEQKTGRLVIGEWEPVLKATLYHQSKWLSYKVPKSLFAPLDHFIELIHQTDPTPAPYCTLITKEIRDRRQARNTIWYANTPEVGNLKKKYRGLY